MEKIIIDYNAGEQVVLRKTWEQASHALGLFGFENNAVRLIAIEPYSEKVHGSEIFITESLPMARGFVESFGDNSMCAFGEATIFVQDYDTYEDAYKVALDMQEGKENQFN